MCGRVRYLLRDLRTHPDNFPDPSPAHGLRMERPLMLIALIGWPTLPQTTTATTIAR